MFEIWHVHKSKFQTDIQHRSLTLKVVSEIILKELSSKKCAEVFDCSTQWVYAEYVQKIRRNF